MGAIRYSCPIRQVPNYIQPVKEIRLLGKFHPDSFKTERLVCLETDGQTDMARSTRLVMLIKNIYTLWDRKRLLHCVANFWLKSIYPLQEYKELNGILTVNRNQVQVPVGSAFLDLEVTLKEQASSYRSGKYCQ